MQPGFRETQTGLPWPIPALMQDRRVLKHVAGQIMDVLTNQWPKLSLEDSLAMVRRLGAVRAEHKRTCRILDRSLSMMYGLIGTN